MDEERQQEMDLAVDYLTKAEYSRAKFFPKAMTASDIAEVIGKSEDILRRRNIDGAKVEYIDGCLVRGSMEADI